MKIFENQVSVKGMMETVSRISGWERLAGSDEEAEAFSYLETRLKDMGYETRLMKHDAFISIPISSAFTVGRETIPSRTHSMSKDTGRDGVEGELIYCKNLLNKEYTGDCKDKIILTPGRAVFPLVEKAQTLGAAGVVFIQELPVRECIPSAAWGSPTPFNKDLLPALPLLSIGEPDGNRLLRQMKLKAVRAHMVTELDSRWRKIPLLTGEIKAPLDTSQFVMFSGHVDSWYYGAIDNGTANAVQLETARIVSMNQNKLRRNFRVVFFSGHSQGRYAGSAWYSDEYWEDIHQNCVININADSLGGKGASDITRSIIMPEAKELAVEIIRAQTGVEFLGSRCKRLADQSFWNAGVTSAFASFSKQPHVKRPDGTYGLEKGNADLGWWWHTPEDKVENVDEGNLERDAKIFVAYAMGFLTEKILPLDFRKTAGEIRLLLEEWQRKAGDRFSLESCIRKAIKLEKLCEDFYRKADIPEEEKNLTILALGRILVPLNYTTGDIYQNDSAVPLDPMPSLALINKLAGTADGSDEAYEIRVELMHKRNYVEDSLNRATGLLECRIGNDKKKCLFCSII